MEKKYKKVLIIYRKFKQGIVLYLLLGINVIGRVRYIDSMLAWKEGCDIAIWGTGSWGKRLYYRYRNRYQIICFIDNFSKADNLDGIPIISGDMIGKLNCRILIAVQEYESICNQCILAGKQFYRDYLPYLFFEYKEIPIITLYNLVKDDVEKYFNILLKNQRGVLLIGNCQAGEMKKLLMQRENGNQQEIIFINIPLVHLLTKDDIKILWKCRFIFEKSSLIITQHISDKTGYILGTDNILEIKGKSTEIVYIPSLWFDLYYPQSTHQRRKFDVGRGGAFPYADAVIDDLVKRYTVSDVLKIIHNENLFSNKFLDELYEYRISDLTAREELCDVKMLDYLIANWQNELLFFSVNHPAKCVMLEETNRLLEFLGYECLDTEKVDIFEMDFSQSIIYPSVKLNYALTFEHNYYKDACFDGKRTMDEYIEEYISCVHPHKFKEYFIEKRGME